MLLIYKTQYNSDIRNIYYYCDESCVNLELLQGIDKIFDNKIGEVSPFYNQLLYDGNLENYFV